MGAEPICKPGCRQTVTQERKLSLAMFFRWAADAVVVIHGAFVLFVALGALLLLRWPRLAWLHLPCAVWGALVELAGWICPLTPLENRLRELAGRGGYTGGFIERYLVPLIYPGELTREIQIGLGLAVIVFNAAVYAWAWRRHRRRRR
jgi:hypothetical protein